MSEKVIKFGMIAGEISPTFVNRGDLEKYDFALKKARNWFVDYRGGLSNRGGTEFYEYLMHDDQDISIFPFQFSFRISNTYLLVFGHNYVRFVQDGAYVLESGQGIDAFDSTDPAHITQTAHGYANGDWIKLINMSGTSRIGSLTGTTAVVTNATADEYDLYDTFGEPLNLTGFGTFASGSTKRIYTLTTPFASTDLSGLHFSQVRDTVRITSLDFPPYDLIRNDTADWELNLTSFDNVMDIPTGLSFDAFAGGGGAGSGTAGMLWAVTAVNADGEESLPSDFLAVTGSNNYAATAGQGVLTWDRMDGVHHYNVYRSIIVSKDTTVTRAAQLGYVGRAYGPIFIDNNIIPDFATTPPVSRNPFAPSKIESIDVDDPGVLYAAADTMTVTDADGSGFIGYLVVNNLTLGPHVPGDILHVVVINGGRDYTSPVVAITTSTGSGALFTINKGPDSGTYPKLSCVFQQRQIYAATENDPLTIWGSRPGKFNNFDVSDITLDNDSYDFEVDSPVVESIRHLLPTRSGLLALSRAGMWQLVGTNGGPLTPTDALAERQSYNGCSAAPPVQINEDIVIIDEDNSAARLLTYSDFSKTFASMDVSILSNHLFSQDAAIESWAYFNSPYKNVLAQTAQGLILCFTVVKEQSIFAWTPWATNGYFRALAKVKERRDDRAYVVVERTVRDRKVKYLEGFVERQAKYLDSFWFLDCALALGSTEPNADLTADRFSGEVTLRSSVPIFSSGDVGKIWRYKNAKGTVTEFVTSSRIRVELIRDIEKISEDAEDPALIESRDWSLNSEYNHVDGLRHLEGCTVSGLFDGKVVENLTVEDGRVYPGFSFSAAVVGLPYTALGEELPITSPKQVVEDDRKAVVAVSVRMNESKGLKFGSREGNLREFKEPTNPILTEPENTLSKLMHVSIDPIYDDDGGIVFSQENPLPATILGYVRHVDLGDDTGQ